MAVLRMPLRVGEVVTAVVRRKLANNRVLISLKGHTLVCEPEEEMAPGDELRIQIIGVFPRIRLRLLPSSKVMA